MVQNDNSLHSSATAFALNVKQLIYKLPVYEIDTRPIFQPNNSTLQPVIISNSNKPCNHSLATKGG